MGHTTNIYIRNIVKKNPKPKFTGNFFNFKRQGHQELECRSKVSNTHTTPRFEGYCYNYQKYGHRAQECRSQAKSE